MSLKRNLHPAGNKFHSHPAICLADKSGIPGGTRFMKTDPFICSFSIWHLRFSILCFM